MKERFDELIQKIIEVKELAGQLDDELGFNTITVRPYNKHMQILLEQKGLERLADIWELVIREEPGATDITWLRIEYAGIELVARKRTGHGENTD